MRRLLLPYVCPPSIATGFRPGIFLIFRRCVIRYLVYLHFLASHTCLHWTAWVSGISVAPFAVFVDPTLLLRVSCWLLHMMYLEVYRGLTTAITGEEFPCIQALFHIGSLTSSGVYYRPTRSWCSAVVSRCTHVSFNGYRNYIAVYTSAGFLL